MAGRGNLLRQFLQTTNESGSEENSGSGQKHDSGLDTNSPSMTVRSQGLGRGKVYDFISTSSSSEGVPAGRGVGRGRALLASLGLESSGSQSKGPHVDDEDSAVGSGIGPVPIASGRGAGRGNFLKCIQMMEDVSIEKTGQSKPSVDVPNISIEKTHESSKDEAFVSMQSSIPEEIPREPLIKKGEAGELNYISYWSILS